MVRAFVTAGDLKQALRIIESQLAKAPNEAELLLLKGDVLLESGQSEKATSAYMATHELMPDDQEPFLRMAEMHESAGRLEQAAEFYNKAIQLVSTDPLPYLMRSSLMSRMGREREAESDRMTAAALRRQRGAIEQR